jgi:hypothetical protein
MAVARTVTVKTLVQGETVRLTIPLLEDGVALNGTGFTVTALNIVGNDGTVVTTTGDFGWVTAAEGTVYYDPDADDFESRLSPYQVQVVITDGSSKVRVYPNQGTAELKVLPRL